MLKVFWGQCANDMMLQTKKKNCDSKIAMVAKKLDYVQDNVRDLCLKMYMEACTYKHALAFFQWRERFAPNTDKGIL